MAKERESIRQFPVLPAYCALLGDEEQRLRAFLAFSSCLALVCFLAWLADLPLVPVLFGGVGTTLFALLWLARSRPQPTSAMADARLMALSARIRPHFLFNSLNAVLGTIRTDPRRAESALEELSDLFRALLQEPKELVLLSEELSLCRKYLDLERLRLGERVQVQWDIDRCPVDALMPPLMLQPLLENAIYHGIEPLADPGVISIRLVSDGGMLAIELSNPVSLHQSRDTGNRLALNNIRERLSLFYGQGASLSSETRQGRYVVRVAFPYRPPAKGMSAT